MSSRDDPNGDVNVLDSTLIVLEAQEPGNDGLQMKRIPNSVLALGMFRARFEGFQKNQDVSFFKIFRISRALKWSLNLCPSEAQGRT